MSQQSKYQDIANKIGSLVDEKNAAYGNSFEQAGEFLRLLYPDGISPDKYRDMLCVVRIFDKLKRIATKKGAFEESPYQDIVGYGLLGAELDSRNQPSSDAKKEDTIETSTEPNVAPLHLEATENVAYQGVSATDASAAAEDSVAVNCHICGKYVATVSKGMASSKFAHDGCWRDFSAPVKSPLDAPL